ALPRLEGTYGIGVVSPMRPGEVVGARFGSPLVVGLGEEEHLLASDPVAIAPHTARVAFLQDGEVVRLTPHDFELRHLEHGPITPRIDRIDWKPDAVELGGHAHYMLKEIREQPDTVVDACRGRLRFAEATAAFGGLNLSARQLRRVRRIVFAACGTSWHAALVGEYLIERLAHLPVEVEYASEFRYRNAPLDDRTLVFVLSQSGETADTLGALREAKRRGHPTLAIVNTVGSTIAREADGGIYLHAGPEVGVASTKAFSAQVTVLTLLAIYLGRLRQLSFSEGLAVVKAMESVPALIGETLKTEPMIDEAAERIVSARSALYLGRDIHYPVALEGALKLKEISYIHAEGYPTAEMKHGPIALIDRETPCIFVAPRGSLHAKTLSNIEEVRAREAMIIGVGTEGDEAVASLSDVFLPIPDAPEVVQPLLAVVPLQLLAYHVARRRGCDIDKPRNLAKSVTVE
ncbi:MAG: glutamine--fructose-6-phosphate transaminase (isomerizing), partial [Isosphaeraceae bacterium]